MTETTTIQPYLSVRRIFRYTDEDGDSIAVHRSTTPSCPGVVIKVTSCGGNSSAVFLPGEEWQKLVSYVGAVGE